MIPIAIGMLPETMTQCRRIITDGGTIIDQKWMDRVIRTLKAQGIYSSCKFLADANFAVKKDGSNAVSTLYDISGNNNDAVQATGANQPIWTAAQQNGKAGLVFTFAAQPNSSYLTNAGNASFVNANFSYIAVAKRTLASADYIELIGVQKTVNVGYACIGSHASTYEFFVGNSGLADTHFGLGLTINTSFLLYVSSTNGVSGGSITIDQVFKDGVSTTGNTIAITNADSTAMSLGAVRGGAEGWGGSKMFDAIFSVTLSTAQRQAMESLLNGYYQIY